jgi:hypothetical protein
VPAKITGDWTARVPASISRQPMNLRLQTQRVTRVLGTARVAGKDVIIDEGSIRGNQLKLRFFVGERSYEFTGEVGNGTIEGTVEGRGLKERWSAARAG